MSYTRRKSYFRIGIFLFYEGKWALNSIFFMKNIVNSKTFRNFTSSKLTYKREERFLFHY